MGDGQRAGSVGERMLQARYGSEARAQAFYREQVLDHLNDAMRAFIARMELVFVATSGADGTCDCSLRAGPPGFVQVLDARGLMYPEYRGNGVLATQGNLAENGHIGLLFLDFLGSSVGLHVNGRARIADQAEALALAGTAAGLREGVAAGGRQVERWVVVAVGEAYIHCSKHVPLFAKRDKEIAWGTDDPGRKGGDYFGVSAGRRPPWAGG